MLRLCHLFVVSAPLEHFLWFQLFDLLKHVVLLDRSEIPVPTVPLLSWIHSLPSHGILAKGSNFQLFISALLKDKYFFPIDKLHTFHTPGHTSSLLPLFCLQRENQERSKGSGGGDTSRWDIHTWRIKAGRFYSSSCNRHILCSHPFGNNLYHKEIDCISQSVMLESFWLPEWS